MFDFSVLTIDAWIAMPALQIGIMILGELSSAGNLDNCV
jgi:hypothetical protein